MKIKVTNKDLFLRKKNFKLNGNDMNSVSATITE